MLSVFYRPSKIKFGKRSLMYCKVDTGKDDIQCSSSPKSKIWCPVDDQDATAAFFETNFTRKFAADLSFNSLYL